MRYFSFKFFEQSFCKQSFFQQKFSFKKTGNIHSALKNHEQAVNCLEHQRSIAQELGDRYALSDATSSLGQVFLQMKDLEAAKKLHLLDQELCESLVFQVFKHDHVGIWELFTKN